MAKLRKMSSSQVKRMKKNRAEISKGNLPCERFLGQMSLDKGSENLQNKIAKIKI